ncbi:hypothetical protein H8959_009219 [Pygathrix nigripes]
MAKTRVYACADWEVWEVGRPKALRSRQRTIFALRRGRKVPLRSEKITTSLVAVPPVAGAVRHVLVWIFLDALGTSTPVREPNGSRVLVPTRYRGLGLGAVGCGEAEAPTKSNLSSRSRPRGADGRTSPGKGFSCSVSLCGLGLCDRQVPRLPPHPCVQVFHPPTAGSFALDFELGWNQLYFRRIL